MSGETTTYDVQMRYVFKDMNARGNLRGMAHELDQAAHSSSGLEKGLIAAGAAAIGFFGLHAANESFIKFNSEMQDMAITMTALTQANLGEPFELAHKQTDLLIKDFTQFAKLSPLTTKEVVEFGQNVQAGVFTANGSLEDFRQIAEQGALAAKMLGAHANYAGVEIQEMLMGAVRKNMRFARNLMGFAGIKDTEEWNSKTQLERLELVKKALNSPAMKQAGQQFSSSFSGVTSTFKDNLQLALGSIGLPLFKKITAEVERWNHWIEQHPKEIQEFATKFTNALVEGFDTIKHLASFVVDNADTIMGIAKVWGAMKLGSVVSGGAGNFFGGMLANGRSLSNMFVKMEKSGEVVDKSLGEIGKSVPSLIGNIASVAAGLGALYVGLQAFADWLDHWHDKKIAEDANKGELSQFGKSFNRRQKEFEDASTQFRLHGDSATKAKMMSAQDARDKEIFATMMKAVDEGLITFHKDETGKIIADSMIEGSAGMQEAMQRLPADFLKAVDDAFKKTSKMEFDWSRLAPGEDKTSLTDALKNANKGEKETKVNVTINRIEVQSNDPDRFVFQLGEIGRKAAKYPSGARSAREG